MDFILVFDEPLGYLVYDLPIAKLGLKPTSLGAFIKFTA
jgi:hypothetical protein